MKTQKSVTPDKIYNSVWMTKFINSIMLKGKKTLANKIAYNAFFEAMKKLNVEFSVLQSVVKDKISPKAGTIVRKYGGAIYNIPIEFSADQSRNKGIKLFVQSARLSLKTKRDDKDGRIISRKKFRTIGEAIRELLISIYNNEACEPVRVKDEMEKLAKQNKAFAYLMRKNTRSTGSKKVKRGDGLSVISQKEVDDATTIADDESVVHSSIDMEVKEDV